MRLNFHFPKVELLETHSQCVDKQNFTDSITKLVWLYKYTDSVFAFVLQCEFDYHSLSLPFKFVELAKGRLGISARFTSARYVFSPYSSKNAHFIGDFYPSVSSMMPILQQIKATMSMTTAIMVVPHRMQNEGFAFKKRRDCSLRSSIWLLLSFICYILSWFLTN